MKNKVSILFLFLFLFFFTSCKKESPLSLVGQWKSVSDYAIQDNGTFNWVTPKYSQFYFFSIEGRFGSATDVPGISGSFNYDEVLQELTLYSEADRYGNIPGTISLRVEILDRDELILSHSSLNGFIYKTKYTRINQ